MAVGMLAPFSVPISSFEEHSWFTNEAHLQSCGLGNTCLRHCDRMLNRLLVTFPELLILLPLIVCVGQMDLLCSPTEF